MKLDEAARAGGDESRQWQRTAQVIERAVHEQKLVGSVVLVARDGKIVFRKAVGLADRERHVTRWVPEFRPKMPDGKEAVVTVRHLLTHTAGLSYRQMQPPGGPYESAGVSDGFDQPGLTMKEELQRLLSVPLFYAPGTTWRYSLAIDVLGEVMSRAADAPLPELVERLVTKPLSMTDTAFVVRDAARLATPYADGNPPHRMGDLELVPFGDTAPLRFVPSRIFEPRSFVSGGAGMAGTATDFLRFLEAVRQGGAPVLSRDSALSMMSNQIGALRIDIEPTPSWGFGFGGAVLVDHKLANTPQAVGTWKWGGVYGHHWYVDPVNRLTVVAVSNTAVAGLVGGFVEELRNAVYDAIG